MPRQHYDLGQRSPQARPLFLVTRDLTIANGATTTVIADQIISAGTQPVLTAANATAAGIAASIYVSGRAKGSITLTHSAPGADAAFLLTLIG